jgi:hypothetical protein
MKQTHIHIKQSGGLERECPMDILVLKDGDELHGYVNGRKLTSLHNDEVAKIWAREMAASEVYPNRVSGTGMPGRWATAIDGNFTFETFKLKTSAIWSLSVQAMEKASKRK